MVKNILSDNDNEGRLGRKVANLMALYALLLLPTLTPFWYYFLGFSALYQCLALSLETFITAHPAWVFSKLSSKARGVHRTAHDFGMASTTQFTGVIHAIISSLWSLYLLSSNPVIHSDHLFGSTFWSSMHCVHSSALFFTELIELVQQPQSFTTSYGRVILVHHILAIFAFGTGGYGVGNFYISIILLAELSSIFLGIRWFLLQLDFASTPLFKVVENAFVVLFVCVRILFGYVYVTPIFVQDLLPLACGSQDLLRFPLQRGQISLQTVQKIAGVALAMGCAYHAMNAFFLYQIIRMALKSSERGDAGDVMKHRFNGKKQRILSSMPHE